MHNTVKVYRLTAWLPELKCDYINIFYFKIIYFYLNIFKINYLKFNKFFVYLKKDIYNLAFNFFNKVGQSEIRTHGVERNCFQNKHIKPLCHLL